MARVLPALIALVVLGYLGSVLLRPEPTDQTGLIGPYMSESGEVIVLSEVSPGCLRYVFESGDAGRVCQDKEGHYRGAVHLDGQGPERVSITPTADGIRLAWHGGRIAVAKTRQIERIETSFDADGTRLYGQLLIPQSPARLNLVVLVQGSSRASAVLRGREHHFLSARGVAVFVYDKRGTGRSEGRYTQDFEILAMDAAAAMIEARRLLGDRRERAGFVGLSQGGWVAPLAARHVSADFIAIGYGLAVSPAEEERSEIMESIKAAGFSDPEIAAAGALADATVSLAASDFAFSTDRYEALRADAIAQGWHDNLPGDNITGEIAAYPIAAVRLLWRFFDTDTSWFHEPRAVLEGLDIPQLWVIGLRDQEAPPTRTVAVLNDLKTTNPAIEIATFDDAGHAMIERPAGNAHPRHRYVADYIPTLVAFIAGQ